MRVSCSLEGVIMRRLDDGAGRGARAGETNAPPPPGRRRGTARGYNGPLRGAPTGACEVSSGSTARTRRAQIRRSGTSVGKARPGAGVRTPRWRAERRRTFERGCALKLGCADRRAVPLMFEGEKKEDGLPGPQRTGAMTHARIVGKRRWRGKDHRHDKLGTPGDARSTGRALVDLVTAAFLAGAGVLAGVTASIIGGAAVVLYPAAVAAGCRRRRRP